jgi:hypothetical protein
MPLGSRSLRRSTRCCRARYCALLHGAKNRQATREAFSRLPRSTEVPPRRRSSPSSITSLCRASRAASLRHAVHVDEAQRSAASFDHAACPRRADHRRCDARLARNEPDALRAAARRRKRFAARDRRSADEVQSRRLAVAGAHLTAAALSKPAVAPRPSVGRRVDSGIVVRRHGRSAVHEAQRKQHPHRTIQRHVGP